MDISSDDYIMVNYVRLAEYLAASEFSMKYEDRFPFTELYEHVDESEAWYLKPEYNTIYDAIERRWKQQLLEMDIINSI
jgi:hypothetical protein